MAIQGRPLPHKTLQRNINDEVRNPKGSPAQFARRLDDNFTNLEERITSERSGINAVDLNLDNTGTTAAAVVQSWQTASCRTPTSPAKSSTSPRAPTCSTRRFRSRAALSRRCSLGFATKSGVRQRNGLLPALLPRWRSSSAGHLWRAHSLGHWESKTARLIPRLRLAAATTSWGCSSSSATATALGGVAPGGSSLDTSPTDATAHHNHPRYDRPG